MIRWLFRNISTHWKYSNINGSVRPTCWGRFASRSAVQSRAGGERLTHSSPPPPLLHRHSARSCAYWSCTAARSYTGARGENWDGGVGRGEEEDRSVVSKHEDQRSISAPILQINVNVAGNCDVSSFSVQKCWFWLCVNSAKYATQFGPHIYLPYYKLLIHYSRVLLVIP